MESPAEYDASRMNEGCQQSAEAKQLSAGPQETIITTEKNLYPEIPPDKQMVTEGQGQSSSSELPSATVETGSSFWDVNGYKKTVRRTDDGAKLCDEFVKLVNERADIEALYLNKLRAWAKKWNDSITKSPEYGTAEIGLKSVVQEAEKIADIHHQVNNALLQQVSESVTQWKKNNYHKSMMSWKESKTIEEGFSKSQKPWVKKFDEVNKRKKAYYAAHVSHNQAKQAQADAKLPGKQLTDEQLRKLEDKVVKTEQEVGKTRINYQESLRDISNYNPKFEEDMKYWFTKAQCFEQERKDFMKQVLLSLHGVLGQTQFTERFSDIENSLLGNLNNMNSAQDLEWYDKNYGASMPIHWPEYEEYDPSASVIASSNQTAKDNKKPGPQASPENSTGGTTQDGKPTKSGICTTL